MRSVDEERGQPGARQAAGERSALEVLGDRGVRVGRALDADPLRRLRRRGRGIDEEQRPDDGGPLEQVGLRRLGPAAEGLDLVEPRDPLGGEAAAQVRPELAEDLAVCSERVDAEDAEQPLGMSDQQVQGEMPAPRVADRPRPVDAERVEHGEPAVEGGVPRYV